MRLILFLTLFFSNYPLFAQNEFNDKLLGTWKLQSMDSKKMMPGISMILKVAPETLVISNEFDEINCSWILSNNCKYIYCSNEKSDEDWLLLELSDDRLVFSDKGKKMEFIKVDKYNEPTVKDLYAEVSKSETLERDRILLGDWKLMKIDSKDVSKQELSLAFRPKGAIYYHFGTLPTPASWILNKDKKSITLTAYNGQTEIWIISSFKNEEMNLFIDGKYYLFSRK